MRTSAGRFAQVWLWAIMAVGPYPAFADGIGLVAGCRGEASIVRGEKTMPAEIGMAVLAGDTLRTGPGGRIRVLLSDDSLLSLGSNSELGLAEHQFEDQTRRTRIDLFQGMLRSLVLKSAGGRLADFEVRTGNVVSGVRGTEFVVRRDAEGARIAVLSGQVEFRAGGGAGAMLAAGFGCDVGATGGAEPVALAEAEIRSLRQATDAETTPEMLAAAVLPSREVLEEGSLPPVRDRMPEQQGLGSSKESNPSNRVGFGGDAGTDFGLGQVSGINGPQQGQKTGDVRVSITLRPR